MTTGPLEPEPPVVLGDYIVLSELGRGGMGVVYLARAPDGSKVAIKVIRHQLDDEDAETRFRREVELARLVPRHCTAPVIDADLDHDPPYLVTEYVKGDTLEDAVAEEPLSPFILHGVAIGIADALTEIHRRGVVHGDLTPRNVLLSPSGPRVIDFGIARVPTEVSGSTAKGFRGTPPFMAPEHFDERPVRQPADIFAWGSVIAFAGTGRKPFGNGAPLELGRRISQRPPDLDGLDPVLRAIVEAAMQKLPAARPSAPELRERLTAASRTAEASGQRAVVVDEVLRTAERQPDAPAFTTMHGWREGPGLRGGALLLVVTAALVGLGVISFGVWVQRPELLWRGIHWSIRWLFGLGAFAVPVVLLAWLAGFMLRPRVPPMWRLARAVVRDRHARWRALGNALKPTGRSVWLGPALVLLCSLCIVHVVRGAPPLNVVPELQRSGGVIGGFFAVPLVEWTGEAEVLLGVFLLCWTVFAAWRSHQRWGRRGAVVTLGACLVVGIVPGWYLKDHQLNHWIAFDNDHVAVFRGISTDRWEAVRTTAVESGAIADISTDLHELMAAGIPVESVEDGMTLALDIPARLADPTEAYGYTDEARWLSPGTCLKVAESGAPDVDCRKEHGGEVYATLTTPFRRYPGRSVLETYVALACEGLFEGYVGTKPTESEISYTTLEPEGNEWRGVASAVACVLVPGWATTTTGSLKSTRRIVEDDFTVRGYWPDGIDNDQCTLGYGDGEEYRLQKKLIATFCASAINEASLRSSLAQNVDVRVEASMAEGDPASGRVGLACHYTDDLNLYVLSVSRDGFYRVARVRGGDWHDFVSDPRPLAISPSGPIEVRAECRSHRGVTMLSLWVNARKVGTYPDKDPLPPGRIGTVIEAPGSDIFDVSFDNLVVSRPKGEARGG
jgi:predicted Ser/Thr protein kinase